VLLLSRRALPRVSSISTPARSFATTVFSYDVQRRFGASIMRTMCTATGEQGQQDSVVKCVFACAHTLLPGYMPC
jgi:hypothetical protein